MPTRLEIRSYWVPKAGNPVHEWEDGCAFSEAAGRIAVADGASSAFDAQRWSQLLASRFLDDPVAADDGEAIMAWIKRRTEEWNAGDDQADRAERGQDDAAWYVHEASSRGSFATFLGFNVSRRRDESLDFQAVAVGDTCLFHVRDDTLVSAFPLREADHFGTTPELVATAPQHLERTAAALCTARGRLNQDDTVVLATDAVAEWALGTAAHDPDVWMTLAGIRHDTFGTLIADLRAMNLIENDDCTLVRCRVLGTEDTRKEKGRRT